MTVRDAIAVGGGAAVPNAATAEAELAPPGTAAGRRRAPTRASTAARSPTARASRCAPTSRWPSTAWQRAARADGVALLITSAFRSDAEQARLFAAHPDPKWVAPPGRSLHRLGTELDLGPPARLRLAGGQRRALPLPAALLVGGLAFRLHR